MMLLHGSSHSLYARHGTPSSSAFPSRSMRTRARTFSHSSMHSAHRRPSPSLYAAAKPTLHSQSTTTQPFICHQGSVSSLSAAATPSCAFTSSCSGSSCLFRHDSTNRTQRFEVLVPHAGGRDGGKGGQPSPQGRGRSGGRVGGRGRGILPSPLSPEDKVPSLEACLAKIQQLQSISQLHANPTAYCLYNLGKRVSMETRDGLQLSSDRSAILAAADTVAHLLLEQRSARSAPLVMQLDSKHLSQLSWAVSALKEFDARAMSKLVRELCYALAERASQPGVMDANRAEACRGWAGVLYGLGKAGVKCTDNDRVQEMFRYALGEQLPDLLLLGQTCYPQSVSTIAMACVYVEFKGSMEPFISAVASRIGVKSGGVMAGAKPQEWSNLIWACGKLVDMKGGKGSVLGKGVNVVMQEGAAAMALAVGPRAPIQPKAQELSNTLWGLAHFEWYKNADVIKALAEAFVQRISSSTSQAVANVLLALAKKGWYDDSIVSKLAGAAEERVSNSVPQNLSNNLWALSSLGWYECTVYDVLLWGLVKSTKQPDPQHFSNAIYSCAMASHFGPAVDALAHVVSKQDLSGWDGQEVSNTLYAWAVLSLLGMTSADLNEMACALFSEASSRGTAAFKGQEITQLYTAHMEVERVRLQVGGLSTGNGLQQAAARQHKQYQAERARAKQSEASAVEKQAMAALQQAGFEVELGAAVGDDGYAVDLLVQRESCLFGIVVDVVTERAFFRRPRGHFSGKVAAVHAQIRQRCDGLVVMREEQAMQPAVVVGAVQQELARVAGQSGAVPGITTSSAGTAGSSQPTAPPSPAATQSPPGLLQPKGRPPSAQGQQNRSAAVLPQLEGKPQRRV